MAIVGVGMAPRGEVGLIVASLGLSLGAIPHEIFSVVVIMSILTTLVVPPILRILYAGHPETAISTEDEASPAADSRICDRLRHGGWRMEKLLVAYDGSERSHWRCLPIRRSATGDREFDVVGALFTRP